MLKLNSKAFRRLALLRAVFGRNQAFASRSLGTAGSGLEPLEARQLFAFVATPYPVMINGGGDLTYEYEDPENENTVAFFSGSSNIEMPKHQILIMQNNVFEFGDASIGESITMNSLSPATVPGLPFNRFTYTGQSLEAVQYFGFQSSSNMDLSVPGAIYFSNEQYGGPPSRVFSIDWVDDSCSNDDNDVNTSRGTPVVQSNDGPRTTSGNGTIQASAVYGSNLPPANGTNRTYSPLEQTDPNNPSFGPGFSSDDSQTLQILELLPGYNVIIVASSSADANTFLEWVDGDGVRHVLPGNGNGTPKEQLDYDPNSDKYTLRDGDNKTQVFSGFSGSHPGALESTTYPDGWVTEVSAWGDGISAPENMPVIRSSTYTDPTTSADITDEVIYSFASSSSNLITRATFTRNSSVQSTVNYSYTEDGQLENVITYDGVDSGPSIAPIVSREYYRWSEDGLQLYLKNDAYMRAASELVSGTVEEASDSFLKLYADFSFEYDGNGRVEYQTSSGTGIGCGCGIGNEGVGIVKFEYFSTDAFFADNRNGWEYRTTKYLPDATNDDYADESSVWLDNDTLVTYSNSFGQPVLQVETDTETSTRLLTWYRYDANGNVIQTAAGPALTGFSESFSDLVGFGQDGDYISDTAGQIEERFYYSRANDEDALTDEDEFIATTSSISDTVAGGVEGELRAVTIRNGESGDPILQAAYTYYKVTDANGNSIYPVATQTKFRTGDDSPGDELTTTYAYTWYSGTTQMETLTTTRPIVAAAENGSGSAVSETSYYDEFGNEVWQIDGGGFITYSEFDAATGAVLTRIVDADSSSVSDPSVTAPTRSVLLPTALHLTTTYEIDNKGRTTKVVEPNGNISYMVYNDAEKEVRTYQGVHLDGSTWKTTGPILMNRMYDPDVSAWMSGSEVYKEELSILVNPSVDGSGVPTGEETFADVNVVSLRRTFTNDSGQVVRVDTYTHLAGVTYTQDDPQLGTEGTDYYSAHYAYDEAGRLAKTTTPNGTINRTVFDGFGRRVSTWIGTDDIPTSNSWSPSNLVGTNMVKVGEYVYDDFTVIEGTNTYSFAGAGNLVQATTILDATHNRYDLYTYDFRSRLVMGKTTDTLTTGSESSTGQRLISTYIYDNLGNVLDTRQYDGDTISLTTNAVTFDSTNAALRRAYSSAEYDSWGRSFRTKVFAVDPTSGTYSGSIYLESAAWYDVRGNVAKTFAPGGLVTKYGYDGAGRNTVVYSTDGGGDPASGASNTYSHALTVTGDNVLEQSEYAYDGSGNLLLSLTRHRFHNDATTGRLTEIDGSIPDGTGTYTGAKARVSYAAYFYDGANRITDMVNVGTNGGSSYTRPGTPPTNSSTGALLTHYAYDIVGGTGSYAGLFATEITDPAGVKSRSYVDIAGRTAWTIEAYDGGSQTATSNRRTLYNYDGSGHVISMKAYTTTTVFQQTTYHYGVTPANGSYFASNEMLYEVRYPQLTGTNGHSASTPHEIFAYDGSGAKKNYVDRNGTVHSYLYDPIGRLFADRIGTIGNGVDDTVRALVYRYDSAGRLEHAQTYSSSATNNFTGTYLLSDVLRTYNGFGQVISEAQPGGTVSYTYSTAGASLNASRLTGMTYGPQSVSYVYDTGVDNNISRLSGIEGSKFGTYGTTRLEGYAYLGLSTIVQRQNQELGSSAHSGTTTYAGLTLASLEASVTNTATGDIYTGLDTFGRIVDQRWIDGTGTSTDQFKYTYDLNSNPTSKKNELSAGHSEFYTYDALNRLATFERGTLTFTGDTPTGTTGTTRTQDWTLDSLGNWDTLDTNGTAVNRTHNFQNQLTAIGSDALAYDPNGNQVKDDEGRTLAYDPWNRLISVTGDSRSDPVWYSYDALGRRITRSTDDLTGGHLDTSFGGGTGYVTYTGASSAFGNDVTVQSSDGKVIVVGQADGELIVLRYLANGSGLDSSFGTSGVFSSDLGGTAARAYKVLLLDSGKILVLARVEGTSGYDETALLRLNSDGTLDTSFGSSGVVATDLSDLSAWSTGTSEFPADLLVRPDGSIVIATAVRQNVSYLHDSILAQYTASGVLDTSWGQTANPGYFAYHTYSNNGVVGIGETQDGSIVVGLRYSYWTGVASEYDVAAVKIVPDGTALDTTFGTDGLATLSAAKDQFPTGMILLPDDRILIYGHTQLTSPSYSGAVLVRLNPDGSPDTSFSDDGIGIYDIGLSASVGLPTAQRQADGRIVLAARSPDTFGEPNVLVARFNLDGSLDTTFGASTPGTVGDGVMDYHLGYNEYAAGAWTLDPDGKILIVGGVSGTPYALKLARLNLGGLTTTSFTYSTSWQLLTEQTEGEDNTTTYVWSAAYVDGMVTRDTFDENDDLLERIYPRQDANWNVTSLMYGSVGAGPTVIWSTEERFVQDPYGGNVTALDSGFASEEIGVNQSYFGWLHFHQGGRIDLSTCLLSFRNRDYNTEQGRWIQQDPAKYVDGTSLYQYVRSTPGLFKDPYGLDSKFWEFINCMDRCKQDNDPLNGLTDWLLAGVAGAFAGGNVPLPKTWWANIADALGDPRLAGLLRDQVGAGWQDIGAFKTFLDALLRDSDKLKAVLKNGGKAAGVVGIALLALDGAVYAHCLGTCACGGSYDESTGKFNFKEFLDYYGI